MRNSRDTATFLMEAKEGVYPLGAKTFSKMESLKKEEKEERKKKKIKSVLILMLHLRGKLNFNPYLLRVIHHFRTHPENLHFRKFAKSPRVGPRVEARLSSG